MSKKRTKTIGDSRVSTADQDLDKNRADVLHLANEKKLGTVEWAKGKVSGRAEDGWKMETLVKVSYCLSILSLLAGCGASLVETETPWELPARGGKSNVRASRGIPR